VAACDLTQLIADSKCLNCFSESEKQSAFSYYLAKALSGMGGTDYSNITTLRQAVACWCVGGQVLDSFKARVAINAAVDSGSVASTPTISQVKDAIRCWDCDIGGEERKTFEIFLLCKLLDVAIP